MVKTNTDLIKDYDKIPTTVGINIPGVYCKNCYSTFAIYPWSALQPHGTDENGKPFYNTCGVNDCGKEQK